MVVAMAVGVGLTNTAPTITVDGAVGMPLSDVAAAITKEGNCWVMTLARQAGIIALISLFVFLAAKRFIRTIGVSARSPVVLVLPLDVFQNLAAIESGVVPLGPDSRR